MDKPLWIIKTGVTFATTREAYGDFEDWIIEKLNSDGPAIRVINVLKGERLPAGEGACGAVITGSHAMVTDGEPWSEALAAWLRRYVNRLPLLGICYGHQLLAHACGGWVDYNPRGAEIGTTRVQLTAAGQADPLFAGLTEFPAHVAHRQSVLRLPPGAVCLARNRFEAHHAFRLGKQAWGVQFHPEFDERIAREYIIQQQSVLQAEKQDLPRLMSQLRPTPDASNLLQRFAELALAEGGQETDLCVCAQWAATR